MAKKNSKRVDDKVDSTNVVVTIKVLGKTYKSEGKTIGEAIASLKPTNCKGKSILIVKRGEVIKERILSPVVTFRLFNTYGLSKDIAIKNVCNLF